MRTGLLCLTACCLASQSVSMFPNEAFAHGHGSQYTARDLSVLHRGANDHSARQFPYSFVPPLCLSNSLHKRAEIRRGLSSFTTRFSAIRTAGSRSRRQMSKQSLEILLRGICVRSRARKSCGNHSVFLCEVLWERGLHVF